MQPGLAPARGEAAASHFAKEWAEQPGLARAEPPAPEREATSIEKAAGYNRSGLRIQAIRIRNSDAWQHVTCERTTRPCLSLPTSVPLEADGRPVAHGPAAHSPSPGYGKPRRARVRCERASGLSFVMPVRDRSRHRRWPSACSAWRATGVGDDLWVRSPGILQSRRDPLKCGPSGRCDVRACGRAMGQHPRAGTQRLGKHGGMFRQSRRASRRTRNRSRSPARWASPCWHADKRPSTARS